MMGQEIAGWCAASVHRHDSCNPPASAALLAKTGVNRIIWNPSIQPAREQICCALTALALGARRQIFRRKTRRQALVDFVAETLTGVEVEEKIDLEAEKQTSADAWVVLVHSELRSCRMPFCKVPGLGKFVCSCARDGVLPPPEAGFGALKSLDGRCTRGPAEIASDLQAAVPVLSFEKAFDISIKLIQSAQKNTVGSATVIGGSKEAAEGFRQQLAFHGFWASIVPISR